MKQLEQIEQRKVISYLEELRIAKLHFIKYTSIPNSTFTSSHSAKTKNILDGLRAGLCDLFIIINQKALFIEMKAEKGVLSDNQKKWIDAINQTDSLKAYVCYSFKEAKTVIDSYL
jgi:hypothetical protein